MMPNALLAVLGIVNKKLQGKSLITANLAKDRILGKVLLAKKNPICEKKSSLILAQPLRHIFHRRDRYAYDSPDNKSKYCATA